MPARPSNFFILLVFLQNCRYCLYVLIGSLPIYDESGSFMMQNSWSRIGLPASSISSCRDSQPVNGWILVILHFFISGGSCIALNQCTLFSYLKPVVETTALLTMYTSKWVLIVKYVTHYYKRKYLNFSTWPSGTCKHWRNWKSEQWLYVGCSVN